MSANPLPAFLLCGLVTIATIGAATAQTTSRPPVGGFGSPANAMIFYVAHGAEELCGPGCTDWIAAEGTVQWDTYKRLINILDRQNRVANCRLSSMLTANPISMLRWAWGVSCTIAASTPRRA